MQDPLHRTPGERLSGISAACGVAAACGALAFAAPARASVVTGTSSGYGISANLVAAGGASLSISPAGLITGTAPSPYNYSGSLASVTALSTLGPIGTGLLTSSANSSVDGVPGSRTTGAAATTNSLCISFLQGSVSLLILGATSLNANASVTGDLGALGQTGGATVTGGMLNIMGTAFNISDDAAANTVLFNSGGLVVMLNEQFVTGNGTSGRGIAVNAIHISFTNFASARGVLNGDVIIGHAEASMSAVPAPSTAAIAGLAGIGALRRRRRR